MNYDNCPEKSFSMKMDEFWSRRFSLILYGKDQINIKYSKWHNCSLFSLQQSAEFHSEATAIYASDKK